MSLMWAYELDVAYQHIDFATPLPEPPGMIPSGILIAVSGAA